LQGWSVDGINKKTAKLCPNNRLTKVANRDEFPEEWGFLKRLKTIRGKGQWDVWKMRINGLQSGKKETKVRSVGLQGLNLIVTPLKLLESRASRNCLVPNELWDSGEGRKRSCRMESARSEA